MSSIVPGYEYDIFVSYRQKDNKYDGWVTEFVENLKRELEATFKEEVSVYFDINPHDGLLETHNVQASLSDKLKCLVFIPIISRTYCDSKSYAWQYEFLAFNKLAKEDQFGRDIKLSSGNTTSRILPVKIHELDTQDRTMLESEISGPVRAIEFIYKEPGVNRPLKPADNKNDNQNKTGYRNQINKVSNAVKEIIDSLLISKPVKSDSNRIQLTSKLNRIRNNRRKIVTVFSLMIILIISAYGVNKIISGQNRSNYYKKIMTKNPVAYGWYMKAEFFHGKDDDSCIYSLNKAIAADPTFALGYAKLSGAYNAKDYWVDPNTNYSQRAYVAAQTAIHLNPDLAEGYFFLAQSLWTPYNHFPHENVIRGYKKAISLNPDFDDAYAALGVIYDHVGLMEESLKYLNKALKLNPDNALTPQYLNTWRYFTANKKDLEEMINLFKKSPDIHFTLLSDSFFAMALITLNRSEEAEKILSADFKNDTTDMNINSAMAVLLAKKGNKAGALKMIESVEKGRLKIGHAHHVVYNLAVAEALIGNNEAAVDKLTWVEENGFPNYILFRDDPLLVSLHQYAPYNELLRKLKIENDNFRRIADE